MSRASVVLKVGAAGSLGSLAWLVSSLLLHGSVAAVIAVNTDRGPLPAPLNLIDIQTSLVDAPLVPTAAPLPEPLPVVAPPRPSNIPPVAHGKAARAAVAPLASAVSTAAPEAEGTVPAVVTVSDAPTTFAMTLPQGPAGGTAPIATAPRDEIVDERGVSVRASVSYGPAPAYPTAARDAQIETDVPAEIVVSPTGRVIDARITRHAGYGLDEATLDAIRSYRFTPAEREGHAVAVRMLWTMRFRLQ